MQLLDEIA